MLFPQQQKNNLSWLDLGRGKIFARKGGWVIGEAVYSHGYSMLDDLVGEASFFQVLVLNIAGWFPERRFADWLEALFICLSWPDARIWCNQVGSLAGTLRASSVAGACAGVMASDSRMYGPGCMEAACSFIAEACLKNCRPITPEAIVESYSMHHKAGRPNIPGYARPIATGDERVPAMERVARELGFEDGRHLVLAYQIEEVLQGKFGESMNLAGYAAAFLMDHQQNDPQVVFRLLSCWVQSGVQACYAEAADQPPESFFPLYCEDIDYQGKSSRSVPERERG